MAAQLQARGVKLVFGGADNHLLLVSRPAEVLAKDLEARLDSGSHHHQQNAVPGAARSSPRCSSQAFRHTAAHTACGCSRFRLEAEIRREPGSENGGSYACRVLESAA